MEMAMRMLLPLHRCCSGYSAYRHGFAHAAGHDFNAWYWLHCPPGPQATRRAAMSKRNGNANFPWPEYGHLPRFAGDRAVGHGRRPYSKRQRKLRRHRGRRTHLHGGVGFSGVLAGLSDVTQFSPALSHRRQSAVRCLRDLPVVVLGFRA
ncbi:hypothetical protein G6F68_014751 [Rhizopus microsporus]|nr:hypothetical protein G6F68_014751 [Rhizopus microsporus]